MITTRVIQLERFSHSFKISTFQILEMRNPDNKLTSCALKALQINSYHLTMDLFWQIGKDL